MGDSLRSKVFWTDLSAWNNPWYVYVGTPLLAATGATAGSLWGSHLVSGEVERAVVTGLFIALTMMVGFTALAAVDGRGTDDS